MSQPNDTTSPDTPRNAFPKDIDTLLVLGGGGMRGMAHVGVLRAMRELGIGFDAVVGTSIGSLIGAMVASGQELDDIERFVCSLKKDDYFRLNAIKFLFKGIRTPSVYQGNTFRASLEEILADGQFSDLKMPFWCNSVCLETGGNLFWGAPGYDDLSLVDAVYASCALPGVFEPFERDGRHYMDGGIVDPLPLRWARMLKPKRIIAVDLSIKGSFSAPKYKKRAIGALFRSFEITQEVIVEQMLHMHGGKGVTLIQPKVGHLHRFDFDEVPAVIEAGRVAAERVLLAHHLTRETVNVDGQDGLACPVEPRDYVNVHLDPSACVGCGMCSMVCESDAFDGLNGSPAQVLKPRNYQCTRDHACVRNCPTSAIRLSNL
ncbi:MAG: patatin-like phospholipase family protein [Planctomycetes bacterium]|nr:patatin-like phospholipase family protein [Planctomycetota bacterium]